MTAPGLSRTELLSRGATGGLVLAAAGTAAGLTARAAKADGMPDADLAFLRLLASVELLAADFYGKALEAQPFGARGTKILRSALFNDGEHYASIAGYLTGAGQVPLTADEIDFSYPKDAFASAGSIARLAVELETVFLGAYLGAVNGLQTASLASPLARIAANQAQHLTAFNELLGHASFDLSFPASLTIDAASNELSAYTS